MTEIVDGGGSFADLAEGIDWTDTVVLHGATSFEASGAARRLAKAPAERLFVVDGPLPTSDNVRSLAAAVEGLEAKTVLAVGGGLVIDTAKLLLSTLSNAIDPSKLHDASELAHRDGIELIAAPTTSGSGAERTPFAVVYVDGVKESVDHPSLQPDIAVLDPELIQSAPFGVVATSGMDAIAHCIESSWSRRATVESKGASVPALERLWASHVSASRGDESARATMLMAASEAGTAIAATRTTAAHALSYYLSKNHGLPHGYAVWITLPALADLHAADAHLRPVVSELSNAMGEGSNSVGDGLRQRLADLGYAATAEEACEGPIDVRAWAESANAARLTNNPVVLEASDIAELIDRSL